MVCQKDNPTTPGDSELQDISETDFTFDVDEDGDIIIELTSYTVNESWVCKKWKDDLEGEWRRLVKAVNRNRKQSTITRSTTTAAQSPGDLGQLFDMLQLPTVGIKVSEKYLITSSPCWRDAFGTSAGDVSSLMQKTFVKFRSSNHDQEVIAQRYMPIENLDLGCFIAFLHILHKKEHLISDTFDIDKLCAVVELGHKLNYASSFIRPANAWSRQLHSEPFGNLHEALYFLSELHPTPSISRGLDALTKLLVQYSQDIEIEEGQINMDNPNLIANLVEVEQAVREHEPESYYETSFYPSVAGAPTRPSRSRGVLIKGPLKISHPHTIPKHIIEHILSEKDNLIGIIDGLVSAFCLGVLKSSDYRIGLTPSLLLNPSKWVGDSRGTWRKISSIWPNLSENGYEYCEAVQNMCENPTCRALAAATFDLNLSMLCNDGKHLLWTMISDPEAPLTHVSLGQICRAIEEINFQTLIFGKHLSGSHHPKKVPGKRSLNLDEVINTQETLARFLSHGKEAAAQKKLPELRHILYRASEAIKLEDVHDLHRGFICPLAKEWCRLRAAVRYIFSRAPGYAPDYVSDNYMKSLIEDIDYFWGDGDFFKTS